MTEEIEFKVGEIHENRKGKFEVISIDGENMTIRWENGEEVDTPMELQQRIIETMAIEKRIEEAAKKSREKAASGRSGKAGKKFQGFEPEDFKNNVTGTHWRSRTHLGGAVTGKMAHSRFSFNSWALYRVPEIQWADEKHRKLEAADNQAKFFARVDESSLRFGFYVERPQTPDASGKDWDHLAAWLKIPDNATQVQSLCAEAGVTVSAGFQAGTFEAFLPEGTGWKGDQGTVAQGDESLFDLLDARTQDRWVFLQFVQTMDKDDVLSRKEKIAEDLAGFFERLMSLYEASVGHLK